MPAPQMQQWGEHRFTSYLIFNQRERPYSSLHFSKANSMPEHKVLLRGSRDRATSTVPGKRPSSSSCGPAAPVPTPTKQEGNSVSVGLLWGSLWLKGWPGSLQGTSLMQGHPLHHIPHCRLLSTCPSGPDIAPRPRADAKRGPRGGTKIRAQAGRSETLLAATTSSPRCAGA